VGALVVLAAQAGSIEPGSEAETVVLVRNTGDAPDQFHVTVQGPAAAWAAVEPSVLTLDAGAEAPAWVRFRPPRSPETVPGDVPFTVVVAPRSDPNAPVSEPGMLAVGTYASLEAAVISARATGQRTRELVVAVHNIGNRRALVSVDAEPADDAVEAAVHPSSFDLGPGQRVESSVAVTTPRRLLPFRRPDRGVVIGVVSDAGALATVRTTWPDEVSLRTELFRSARLLGVILVLLVVGGLALLRSETDSGTVDVTKRSGDAILPTASTTTTAAEPEDGATPSTAVAGPAPAPAPAGGPARPTAAPPLPKLVFVRVYGPNSRDIVVRGGDGRGSELRLRSDDALETRPRLSPDQNWVAFVRERDSTWRVCILPVTGGDAVCLADTTADAAVAWGPDGQTLYFSRGGHLFSLDYDAGTQTVGSERDTGVKVPGGAFALSPDGTRLAAADGPRLYVRPLDGTDGSIITVAEDASDPVWSPDGGRLAYASAFQIFTVPVGGGPLKQMTASGTVNGEPAWTASGEWVVFRSNRSGNGDLYAVRSTSSGGGEEGLAQVTAGSERDVTPSF
jgi:hypothetical protein